MKSSRNSNNNESDLQDREGIVTISCKNCGREFQYSEEAYQFRAEKGDSRIQRCEDCLQSHKKEITNIRSPYFTYRKESPLPLSFQYPERRFTRHDRPTHQRIKDRHKKHVHQGDISITENDIVELYKKLEQSRVVVVVSPTGSGKSTYIPKRLIMPPDEYKDGFVDRLIRQGQVIITQPRILATKRTAQRTAEISNDYLGRYSLFGFRYSKEDSSGPWNKIVSVTDGTLPNWIREGKLGRYSLIMIDEAHERSQNIDLILGFLKRELPKYPQLRVIVSSATINAKKFLTTFNEIGIDAELLEINSNKKYKKFEHFWQDIQQVPGCECWLCKKSENERTSFWKEQKDQIKEKDLPKICADMTATILKETQKGSIVIFLHGEGPIEKATRQIRNMCPNIEVIPVYRRIQNEAEEALRKTERKRRVIVATNIAETSITIPDLVYAINSGWIKQSQWDATTQTEMLKAKLHSRDGNIQRAGRLGRSANGHVYHLFTKEEWEDDDKFEEHTEPEIVRSCLDDSIIKLKSAGITDIDKFPWVENPRSNVMDTEIKRSKNSLVQKGMVDPLGDITEDTLNMLRISRSAVEASCLLLADQQGILFEAVTVLMMMSSRDGEPRTGANLYNPFSGLLVWDKDWSAETKARIHSIHDGLRAGCQDDVDFVSKLAYCFDKTRSVKLEKEWSGYYHVNYENMKKIISERDEIICRTFGEKRYESQREINLKNLEKVKFLISHIWSEKKVRLTSRQRSTFSFGNKKCMISRNCVGGFCNDGAIFAMTFVEKGDLVDGYYKKIPTASFVMKWPSKIETSHLLVDQIFPTQSYVKLDDSKKNVIDCIQQPEPIKIAYRKDPGNKKEGYVIPFNSEFFKCFDVSIHSIEGVWENEQQNETGYIAGWHKRNDIPVVILNTCIESVDLIPPKGKKSLDVGISKVIRDPVGKGGYVSGRINGCEILIEVDKLSINEMGHGLEFIEGSTLNLQILKQDGVDFPQLSNLSKIKKDLEKLGRDISSSKFKTRRGRKYYEDVGHVVEIDEDGGVIVVVPRDLKNGVLHPFKVSQEYIFGDINNLKVIVKILEPLQEPIEIDARYFNNKELENIPHGLKLDREKNTLCIPRGLKESVLNRWAASLEAKEFVSRRSWQYCYQARIDTSEKLEKDIENLRDIIGRKNDNISEVEGRMERARSDEKKRRFQGWIEEDQNEIKNCEQEIEATKAKIQILKTK